MADKIIGVFYLTASQQGVEIPLPKLYTGLINHYPTYDPTWIHAESVSYVFTDLHSGSIELCGSGSNGLDKIYGTDEVAGLKLDASTSATFGPFRLNANPPRYLYSSKISGEPCRVTVIMIR